MNEERLAAERLGVPASYLDNYPFPALVAVIRPHAFISASSSILSPTAATENTDVSAGPARSGAGEVEVIWGNKKWHTLTAGRALSECVEPSTLQRLGPWVLGRVQENAADVFHFDLHSPSTTLRIVKASMATSSSMGLDVHVLTALNPGHASVQGADIVLASSDAPLPSPTDIGADIYPIQNGKGDGTEYAHGSLDATADPAPLGSPLRNGEGPEPSVSCQTMLDTYDWSQTSLGPRSQWSPVIETMLEVVLRSPTQDALWLGPEFHMLYNQKYALIVDHPHMFGKSAMRQDAWGPVWEDVQHLIDNCVTKRESCYLENDLLLYRRGPTGHFVERYHTWSFVPLFDGDKFLGLFNPTIETTAAVLAKRRQETTRDLSEQMSYARTKREYFDGVAQVLERNPKDVPFAALYRVAEGMRDGTVELVRESAVGVPDDHPSLPVRLRVPMPSAHRLSTSTHKTADRPPSPAASTVSSATGSLNWGTGRITSAVDRSTWPIARALATRQCVMLEECSQLVQGFPLRQWDVLPESAMIVPICSETANEDAGAVMIMGLNLLCTLDTAYEDWIQLLRAQLTSSLATVRGIEEDQHRLAEEDKMNRAKTAWFQGAAHDLRSPLTLVAGPLDDILRTSLTKSQRASLSMAQRNVARIQRLVNSLLDFSRIEAGKTEGHFVPIDLDHFVGELAELFRPPSLRKGVKFKSELAKHDGVVHVDPTLLETVVTNLLSNALKYTSHGEIKVVLRYTPTHAEISISDTGCGIPASELGTITNRYNRASTAIASGVEGTGIGLALSKEIIRLHEGELLITSRTADALGATPGSRSGSTFTARLPLIDRQPSINGPQKHVLGTYGKQLVEEAMHISSVSEASFDTLDEITSGASRGEGLMFERSDVILLVDDNREMRSYIKQIFAPFCTVVEAADGREALDIALVSPPDLILSDFMMPRMSGQELLKAIRADPKTEFVPMILLSAATDDELRVSALVAGAEDFMLKPFRPRELLSRAHLHMQLGKKRAHLEAMFALREREIAILSDYCPSGVLRSDSSGTFNYVNAAWRAQVGIPEGDDMNRWPEYLNDDVRDELVNVWRGAVEGDQKETRVDYQWSNGRYVSATLVRLDMCDPRLSGVLGCVQDVTEEMERLHDAERRRIEAEESKRQQELLIDITSHEIRTPVSAILQCSSLVKSNLLALRNMLYQGGGRIEAVPAVLREIDEDLEALESIYQCGLVQERIAGDVLSLAQVQLDMLSIHDVDVDIRAEARKMVSVFTSETKMKGIELVLDLGESLERCQVGGISTDPVRLRQVVTNLVANAIRFTATQPKRRITVRFDTSLAPPDEDSCGLPEDFDRPGDRTEPCTPADEEGSAERPIWLLVGVSDTGPGLSEKEQSVLFQQFSQGNKMIHTRFGGSGLGLYICRKITELLGGRIECKSVLGAGSTFRFYVKARHTPSTPIPGGLKERVASIPIYSPTPVANGGSKISTFDAAFSSATTSITAAVVAAVVDPTSPAGPEVGLRADDAPRRPPLRVSPAIDGAESLHVLIVEDNIINQTVLKRQITKAGWTCDVANNGQEALNLIEANRTAVAPTSAYDVVLMDLEMPVMDGLTAIKAIRQEENEKAYPRRLVIALTGNAREGQVAQALAAGMDDVVIKPYKLPELQSKLRRAVSGNDIPQQKQ